MNSLLFLPNKFAFEVVWFTKKVRWFGVEVLSEAVMASMRIFYEMRTITEPPSRLRTLSMRYLFLGIFLNAKLSWVVCATNLEMQYLREIPLSRHT
jgi:hypothetical protein